MAGTSKEKWVKVRTHSLLTEEEIEKANNMKNGKLGAGGVAQVIECLPSKSEALSSNFSNTHTHTHTQAKIELEGGDVAQW
jgi:hypothetical protein